MLIDSDDRQDSSLARLLTSNTLRMGVIDSGTKELQQEISLQLMNKLAAQFDWKLEVTYYPSSGEVFRALADNEIDLVADVVIDHRVPYNIRYSVSYEDAVPTLVYFPKASKPIKSSKDFIKNQILVVQNSWQSHFASNLEYIYKGIKWQEFPDFWTLKDMIFTIETEPGGYLLVTDKQAKQYKKSYPELEESLRFEPVALAFAFDHDNLVLERFISRYLLDQINRNNHIASSNLLGSILKPAQLKTFLTNVKTRLPKYIDQIVDAANAYSVDWRLLAAVAYQESLWDETAVSPTGVKGLMMLTKATARFMNIDDRTDPAQSIDGGTRYIVYLKDILPKRIEEPDRTWLTLAAYNIGPAHLEDVRIITQKNGQNPNKWLDIRENLPLIEQSLWYRQSQHGYARGREARKYVDNIRNYYQVLIRLHHLSESSVNNQQEVQVTEQTPSNQIILPHQISLRY